jgi:predicted nucleic acid-binding Zn ribbon protein
VNPVHVIQARLNRSLVCQTDPVIDSGGYGAGDRRSSHHEPTAITSSLDAVMRSLKGPGRQQVSGVFGRWEELVGPQIAQHARPIRLDAKVLVIEVDDPAWATQIQLLSIGLRERLATEVGAEVDSLEIRVARRNRAGHKGL